MGPDQNGSQTRNMNINSSILTYYQIKLKSFQLQSIESVSKKIFGSSEIYALLYLWMSDHMQMELILMFSIIYSKTCVKQPLKNRQNKDLNDNW